jgi:hypothetical protein
MSMSLRAAALFSHSEPYKYKAVISDCSCAQLSRSFNNLSDNSFNLFLLQQLP